MQGLRQPEGAAKSQIGFIDFVLLPLVTPMFRMFRGLAKPEEFLEENRQRANNLIVELTGMKTNCRRGSRMMELESKGKGRKKLKSAVKSIKKLRQSNFLSPLDLTA